eukprot:gene40825-49791_t
MDEQDALARLVSSAKSLKKQEEELLKEIAIINNSFSNIGIPAASIAKSEDANAVTGVTDTHEYCPQDDARYGLKLHAKLSFRGKDKCAEYFDLVDKDKSGLLGYQDMRAMHSFAYRFGLGQRVCMQSRSAWLSSLREQDSQEQTEGLDASAFFRTRERVEQAQPLGRELVCAGLGLLPQYLQRSAALKRTMRDLLRWRE